MLESRGKFIKWVVILAVLMVLGGVICSGAEQLGFWSGLGLGYIVCAVAYGCSLTRIGFIDNFTDSSIGGAIKLGIAFTAGWIIFPVHLIKGIVRMIKGEM